MSDALDQRTVLVVDGQSTGASPAHGHLLELGWARLRASDAGTSVTSQLLALPEGATIPRPVARLTGIRPEHLVDASAPASAWAALREAAADGDGTVPLVIHYARFELPFLHELHREHGPDRPFPSPVLCTHEIARRLLPDLPRRGLRALAGYFGHGVDELKRSAEHVEATAVVWRHLVARLRDEHGITTLEALGPWLESPAPKPAPRRAYPMDRSKRLALPDRPGVYRMRREGGDLLYVGKATSLRQRVNGYFRQHRRVAERTLEMLTQARELDVTPTETVLEAALLETDEIKTHAPPYNVMLRPEGRRVWHAARDLQGWSETADRAHPVGPLGSRATLRAWIELLDDAAYDAPPPRLARLLGWDPALEPAVWREGAQQFRAAWLSTSAPAREALARAGARISAAWREARAEAESPDDAEGSDDESTPEPGWDPTRVRNAIERIVAHGAHQLRRAPWLCRLADSTVAWGRSEGPWRVLVLARGRVVHADWLAPGAALPVPPGHDRPVLERRDAFDFATFDRLRVLGSELRRILADARPVRIRLGPRQWLEGDRLRRTLPWV